MLWTQYLYSCSSSRLKHLQLVSLTPNPGFCEPCLKSPILWALTEIPYLWLLAKTCLLWGSPSPSLWALIEIPAPVCDFWLKLIVVSHLSKFLSCEPWLRHPILCALAQTLCYVSLHKRGIHKINFPPPPLKTSNCDICLACNVYIQELQFREAVNKRTMIMLGKEIAAKSASFDPLNGQVQQPLHFACIYPDLPYKVMHMTRSASSTYSRIQPTDLGQSLRFCADDLDILLILEDMLHT